MLLDLIFSSHSPTAGVSIGMQTDPLVVGLLLVITLGHSIQSDLSINTQDSSSAVMFWTPAKCVAWRLIFCVGTATTALWLDGSVQTPELVYIYMAVVLSIFRWIRICSLPLAKHFTAGAAASSSRQLMCFCFSVWD